MLSSISGPLRRVNSRRINAMSSDSVRPQAAASARRDAMAPWLRGSVAPWLLRLRSLLDRVDDPLCPVDGLLVTEAPGQQVQADATLRGSEGEGARQDGPQVLG
ncbi:hypothetical protein EHYA_09982 [Embleya hyalina]|uniref:Uncharacterized protein n=1 Tax=Embleya hyalina TaxID=516124 RepID=A0A401Z5T2_9ACTN|nr:hypothetical protein EHYA_09982 [Embleya hyalina]